MGEPGYGSLPAAEFPTRPDKSQCGTRRHGGSTGLAVGNYTGTIAVTTNGGTQNVGVTLSVVSNAILVPNPGSLFYSAQSGQGNPANQTVFFGASNSSLNPISITAVSNANWISLVNTGSAFVTVGVDQTGLTTGTYSGSITVTQTGAANSPLTIPVLLAVNGGGGNGSGSLTFSPTSIAFTSSTVRRRTPRR